MVGLCWKESTIPQDVVVLGGSEPPPARVDGKIDGQPREGPSVD